MSTITYVFMENNKIISTCIFLLKKVPNLELYSSMFKSLYHADPHNV